MNITPNVDNTFTAFSNFYPDGRLTGTIGKDNVTVKIRDIYSYEIDEKLVVIDIGNASVRYFAPSSFHKELKDFEESLNHQQQEEDPNYQ